MVHQHAVDAVSTPPNLTNCTGTMHRVCLTLLLIATWHHHAHACVIAGRESGSCAAMTPAVADRMPFCARVVPYTACLPREYPWWPTMTLEHKDAWVATAVSQVVSSVACRERGGCIGDDPAWSNATGTTGKRFSGPHGTDCMNAFTNFMCWMNFPRCDDGGRSLLMCRSACLNLFKACGYTRDMTRCYDPAFFGGFAAEGATRDQLYDATGAPLFLRAALPGLPFADNQRDEAGNELAVCTPAITGGAASATVALSAVFSAIVATCALAGDRYA